MVHDIGTIISQKVRAAEQIPVHWEKAQVWKNIKRGPDRNRALILYYAAASIILATSLVVYFLNRMESEQSHRRIQALEAAINNHLKEQGSKVADIASMQPGCETASPVRLMAAQGARTARRNTPAGLNPIAALAHSVEEQPEVLMPKNETVAIESQPGMERATDKPKIEAIIGFIPPPQEKVAAVKVKKMKFRFLRENDQPLDKRSFEDHSAFITARIN